MRGLPFFQFCARIRPLARAAQASCAFDAVRREHSRFVWPLFEHTFFAFLFVSSSSPELINEISFVRHVITSSTPLARARRPFKTEQRVARTVCCSVRRNHPAWQNRARYRVFPRCRYELASTRHGRALEKSHPCQSSLFIYVGKVVSIGSFLRKGRGQMSRNNQVPHSGESACITVDAPVLRRSQLRCSYSFSCRE